MFSYGEIDEFCLMCDAQSRERWRPPQNPLESSLGEKTEFTNLTRAHSERNMIGSAVGTAAGSTGPQEGWTECFQDLQTWCPPPQDELNTPQVTTECFNFGTIDQCQVRDLDDLYPVDLMPDTLGGDMAYMQPLGLEEENNNTPPYLKLPQTSTSSGGKLCTSFPVPTKSPLKSTSSNILLSQSMEEEKTPFELHKIRGGMDMDNLYAEGTPFDLAEDEENFLAVPPDQVAKRQEFRVPVRTDVTVKKERPKLKLDITLPNPPAVVMPSTPEVQNVLSEPNVGFDLIKYVVSGDYVNAGTVGGVAPTSKVYESVTRDHDYTDPLNTPIHDDFFVIKSEPISPEDLDLKSGRKRPTEKRAVKRRSDSNSDYIFDSDFGNSDESKEWEPSTSKGRKPPKAKKPKKEKKVKEEESDDESVASSALTDKYRELRDKNNEASRRSRLNRKQRDMEMKRTADKLESQNRALRARAERMQKLVLEMRETIMRTIKNAKR